MWDAELNFKTMKAHNWITRGGKRCGFISYEAPLIDLKALFGDGFMESSSSSSFSEVYTMLRNPVKRFISANEHDMHRGRCERRVAGTATRQQLSGKCKLTDYAVNQVGWSALDGFRPGLSSADGKFRDLIAVEHTLNRPPMIGS